MAFSPASIAIGYGLYELSDVPLGILFVSVGINKAQNIDSLSVNRADVMMGEFDPTDETKVKHPKTE